MTLNPTGFRELDGEELFAVDGGIAPLVVCAWLILGYIASPVIYYAGEALANTFKAGYANGVASRG
jgi:lactobin A/cerein 7B family class IIb bacteriocin